ncbi:MAG: hypothetical protein RL545_271, partial [Actinomycetota bacterium]
GDTREAMAVVAELGGSDWFILGDRDIGLRSHASRDLRASVRADVVRGIRIARGRGS